MYIYIYIYSSSPPALRETREPTACAFLVHQRCKQNPQSFPSSLAFFFNAEIQIHNILQAPRLPLCPVPSSPSSLLLLPPRLSRLALPPSLPRAHLSPCRAGCTHRRNWCGAPFDLEMHQIRGWRAVSAAGLHGQGYERNAFSQTPVAMLPPQGWSRRWRLHGARKRRCTHGLPRILHSVLGSCLARALI